MDVNVGTAAVYSPVDVGFPDNGVLACGEMNVPGWVYADMYSSLIREVRANGQVLNFKDWEEQEDLAIHVSTLS